MDIKTIGTGQEQFAWTGNHSSEVVQPMYFYTVSIQEELLVA